MRTLVLTAPQPLISVREAADHLKLDGEDEDELLQGMIEAACAHIDGPEGILGRAIGMQDLETRFDVSEIAGPIRLPCPPLVEVLGVSFRDTNRALQTVDPAAYETFGQELAAIGSAPWSGSFYGREVLRVKYSAGYEQTPPAIRAALLMMVADLYANRDTTVPSMKSVQVPMSTTVEALLQPFRVYA